MIVGAIWFLQGIRVLPGSFMTGSTFWAVGGAIVALGDSITAGNNNHGIDATDSWPIQLATALGTGYRVQNAGVSSQTLPAVMATLPSLLNAVT